MPYRKVKQNTVHNRSPTLVSRFRNIGYYSRIVEYAAGVIAPRQFGSSVQGGEAGTGDWRFLGI